jgi:sugar lactone lactonase YvrE
MTAGFSTTLFAGHPKNAGDCAPGTVAGAVAEFNEPADIAVHADGRVWVTDMRNHVVRSIALNADVTTVAGDAGNDGYVEHGSNGLNAQFELLSGIAFHGTSGYVNDRQNSVLRRIDVATTGTFLLAGTPGNDGFVDGPPMTGQMSEKEAFGLCISPAGVVYFAERDTNRIR